MSAERLLTRLPFNQRARNAALHLLDLYGMLVVYSEDADTGKLTQLFGGHATKLELIHYRTCTKAEWERQARWLETKGVKTPDWDADTESFHWVLLRVDLHNHSRREVLWPPRG